MQEFVEELDEIISPDEDKKNKIKVLIRREKIHKAKVDGNRQNITAQNKADVRKFSGYL